MSDVKEDPTTDGASDEKKSSVDDAAISHKSEEEEEVSHLVSGSETLISIAARYDTTPSVLAQHNKLTSRLIFPGQKLRIPPPKAKTPDAPSSPMLSKDEGVKPSVAGKKLEKAEQPTYPEEPEMVDTQFVRVNVRHITDGKGIVSGSLLVTPKVVMFNPSLDDPLVQENDPDSYQLVTPAELIVNFAILRDFVKFKTKEEEEVDESLIFRPTQESSATESSAGSSTTEKLKGMFKMVSGGGVGSISSDSSDSEPMYLRLLMGKPIAKKLPRTAPIISYGEQSLEAQYWFITTAAKAEHLYHFITQNFPEEHRYGRLHEDAIMRSGYELVREGMGLLEAEPGQSCNRETVSRQVALTKTMTVTSVDFAEISDMIGDSELISFEERLELARVMPPRTDGHDWVLKFTTATDGFNLNSFVRKMNEVDGPVLLLIADCSQPQSIFGAFLSESPKAFSESFRGTGETFVFKLRPSGFKRFPWTGENNYFYRLTQESLIVGSGDGNFAIWIDSDFYKGRSAPCSTFDNEQLSPQQDFTIKTLECWAFQM